MSDKFYDFDKDDDDVYEIYKKDASKKPEKKEFEIDISARTANFKSTMSAGNSGKAGGSGKSAKAGNQGKLSPSDKIKLHRLSAGGKAFMVFGIIISCFLTVFGTFSGVVLGPIFSTDYFHTNSPENDSSALKNVEKEEYHIEVNDDGTVTPVYNALPDFDEDSASGSVNSSDSKDYDEPESGDRENDDKNGEEDKTDNNNDEDKGSDTGDNSENGSEDSGNREDSEPTTAPSPAPSASPDEEVFNDV